MTAYNYETQSWLDGEAGARLTQQQLQTALAMANGPQGESYATHCGFASRAGLVRLLTASLAECNALLARFEANESLARELGVA